MRKAIIICPDLPGDKSGYQLAISASLNIYESFYDKVFLVSINDVDFRSENNYYIIKSRKLSVKIRFLISLFRRMPAICVKYYSKRISRELDIIIEKIIKKENCKIDLIFEDIPVAYHLKYISKNNKTNLNRIIIRSHNVAFNILNGLNTSFTFKKLWKVEQKKIFKLESHLLKETFLAISEEDSRNYEIIYDVKVPVMDVIYDIKDVEIKIPSKRNVQIIGGFDLRKSSEVPKVINCFSQDFFSNTTLHLVGRGSDQFQVSSKNVISYGFVKSLSNFLDNKDIFLNPQKIGSGINLKSLFAISNGYLLVSTSFGVEGIPLKHGESFICIDQFKDFNEALKFALSLSNDNYLSIVTKSRKVVNDYFCKDRIYNQFIESLDNSKSNRIH